MVPYLLGGLPLGIKKNGECLLMLVPRAIGTCDLDRMADTPFFRQWRRIDLWSQIDGNLDVTKLHRGRDPVDRHIRGAECCPEVVAVLAKSSRGLLCLRE